MSTTPHQYPPAALYAAVKAEHEAAGVGTSAGVTYRFGAEWVAALDRPPRYVWVPVKFKVAAKQMSRAIDEHRTIAPLVEGIEVGCWGRTRDEASALRTNLVKALSDVAGFNCSVEGGDWEKKTSAHNALGFLCVVEVGLRAPIQDAYAAIPTLDVEDPVVFTPEAVEGVIDMPDTLDDIEQDIQIEVSS